jgi:multidrug efflux pump subunit AcrB
LHRIKKLELTNAQGSKVTLSTITDFKLKHQPALRVRTRKDSKKDKRKMKKTMGLD